MSGRLLTLQIPLLFLPAGILILISLLVNSVESKILKPAGGSVVYINDPFWIEWDLTDSPNITAASFSIAFYLQKDAYDSNPLNPFVYKEYGYEIGGGSGFVSKGKWLWPKDRSYKNLVGGKGKLEGKDYRVILELPRGFEYSKVFAIVDEPLPKTRPATVETPLSNTFPKPDLTSSSESSSSSPTATDPSTTGLESNDQVSNAAAPPPTTNIATAPTTNAKKDNGPNITKIAVGVGIGVAALLLALLGILLVILKRTRRTRAAAMSADPSYDANINTARPGYRGRDGFHW